MTVADEVARALSRVAKWRFLLTAWQLGRRWSTGDNPEADAIMDHREATIMTRVEVSALRELLISKGILSDEECQRQTAIEAERLSSAFEGKFPGVTLGDDDRLHLDDAAEIMKRLHLYTE